MRDQKMKINKCPLPPQMLPSHTHAHLSYIESPDSKRIFRTCSRNKCYLIVTYCVDAVYIVFLTPLSHICDKRSRALYVNVTDI